MACVCVCVYVCVCVFMGVCVCLWREREREREGGGEQCSNICIYSITRVIYVHKLTPKPIPVRVEQQMAQFCFLTLIC